MASIIEGYNYDIFISYRQKDNKHDGWVTEFVNNLKGELESTFKEEISVYFDVNPHDGLLETHDVDESLKEKLKCLIFIPIISRTYCDPKSFAWEHEFKAFVEEASKDQFGLKVKLPNGNVANRVLPVRIHDIDIDDIRLCESVLGSVLRGIDFVFNSTGVNRPLKISDDPGKNLSKTYYPDQINKIANAIKEIIYCLNPETKKIPNQPETLTGSFGDFIESNKESSTVYSSKEITSKSTSEDFHISKPLALLFILAAILLLAFGIFGWIRNSSSGKNVLTTYSTILTESMTLDPYGRYPFFSISPDGRKIAYASEKGILIRPLSDFSKKLLAETERARQIAFSPNGQSLAFEKDGFIYRISTEGTRKVLIYSVGPGGSEIFWGSDDYIYFCPGFGSEGIWRIPADGGKPEKITSVIDSLYENSHRYPQLLPDSRSLIFTALGPSQGAQDSRIIIQDLESGERRVSVDKAIYGRYLFNGSILFSNDEGYIFTIPLNIHKLKITGKSIPVLSEVTTATAGGAAFLSVSETGNIIYLPKNNVPLNIIDVVDKTGKTIDSDSIPITTIEKMGYGWSSMSLSHTGTYLAITGRTYCRTDIWLLNLISGITERITFDPPEDEYPVWSQEGNSIAYTSGMTGASRRLAIQRLNTSGNPHLIRTWPRHIHFTSWSPDGKWLAAYDYTSTQGTDCYTINVDTGDSLVISAKKTNESNGQFSPDGKWLAFQSDESGRNEIYIISFPKLDVIRQVSEEGGELPHWDRSGKFIYYISNGYMIAHPVELRNDFQKGKPVKMFLANASNFEISPDGLKFYLARKNVKRSSPQINLITNLFQELETKSK